MIHLLPAAVHTLSIAHQHLLYARTCSLTSALALLVYRSPTVRHTDPIYAPVREHVEKHRFELHRKGHFIDVDMMFGKGELSVYLHPASRHEKPGDVADALFDLTKAHLEEVTG